MLRRVRRLVFFRFVSGKRQNETSSHENGCGGLGLFGAQCFGFGAHFLEGGLGGAPLHHVFVLRPLAAPLEQPHEPFESGNARDVAPFHDFSLLDFLTISVCVGCAGILAPDRLLAHCQNLPFINRKTLQNNESKMTFVVSLDAKQSSLPASGHVAVTDTLQKTRRTFCGELRAGAFGGRDQRAVSAREREGGAER